MGEHLPFTGARSDGILHWGQVSKFSCHRTFISRLVHRLSRIRVMISDILNHLQLIASILPLVFVVKKVPIVGKLPAMLLGGDGVKCLTPSVLMALGEDSTIDGFAHSCSYGNVG